MKAKPNILTVNRFAAALSASERESLHDSLRHRREDAFRRLAVFALRHAGRGYVEAFGATIRSARFFRDVPPQREVFVGLSDSLTEIPQIAHLAVRGALSDPDPAVVNAGEALLSISPGLSERVGVSASEVRDRPTLS